MEALLLYWLKANVVLALFAAAYYALLRRLTFFGLNRAFLLLALGFAAVYPLLPMPALLPAGAAPLLPALPTGPALPAATVAAAPGFDWWRLAGAVYLAGAAGLLLRLLTQLLSLARLRRRARPAVVLGQPVGLVPGTGSPFSFGSTIYLTESALHDPDLVLALRHEQAHVRQYHTLDVLLLQAAAALCWPNPAAWLLRRLALDNLEYLADEAALRGTTQPRRDYQYLLLRQQLGGVPAPALAFHFSFLTLKNRVLMLNQPASTARHLGRYLLAAPVVVLLALGYAGARAQSATNTFKVPLTGPNAPKQPFTITAPAALDHVVYYVDAQPSTAAAATAVKPNDIAHMDVRKDPATLKHYAHDPAATAVAFITTKANANSPAVLRLADEADLSAAYTSTPAAVNAVVPKALAYITSHYPDARLSGEVTELKKKSTGAVKCQVQLARGKRPFWVYFSPEGDFLGE